MAKVTAVIDIGSNSARMVVYSKTSRYGFMMLNETKSKVRISENAYQNGGNLQEEAMQRAYDALENFLQIATSYKARKTLCVATSALRDAPNKQEFIRRVRKGLGLNIKVITGEKEALFGGIAAANLLPKQHHALSVDIGGGSTEFCAIHQNDTTTPCSLNLGAVRLKELFFDDANIQGAKEFVKQTLAQLPYPKNITTIVGIGGSFRSLALVLMKKQNYPLSKIHGYEIDAKILKKLLKTVLDASEAELKKLHIKDDRIDVIKPGALILLEILKHYPIERVITSGVGVREGVFLADILRNSNNKFPENFNPSIRYLSDRYINNLPYANLLAQTTKDLFELLQEYFMLPPHYKKLVAIAAKLYPIGGSIHFFSKHKHSYYIIQAGLEYGFSHHETMLIATLNRYAKRKLPSQEHYKKYQQLLPKKDTLDALSYILSLAVALHLGREPKGIFRIELDGDLLKIHTSKRMRIAQEAITKLHAIGKLEVQFCQDS